MSSNPNEAKVPAKGAKRARRQSCRPKEVLLQHDRAYFSTQNSTFANIETICSKVCLLIAYQMQELSAARLLDAVRISGLAQCMAHDFVAHPLPFAVRYWPR